MGEGGGRLGGEQDGRSPREEERLSEGGRGDTIRWKSDTVSMKLCQSANELEGK